jgi:hypothetical protein
MPSADFSVCKRADDPRDGAAGPPARQRAFPEAQDRPAGRAQGASDLAITLCVPRELRRPVFPPRAWGAAMAGTSVPEAAVHKKGHAFAAPNKIWIARQFCTAAPAGNVMFTQQSDQSEFSASVSARPDLRHDLRALGSREDVGHIERAAGCPAKPVAWRAGSAT